MREIANHAGHADAIDFSIAALEKGKSLPGGDNPRLSWLNGRVEDTTLKPPYHLTTAAASLHWMDWMIVLPCSSDTWHQVATWL